MRRLLIVFLAFVLPLQMSAAAMHCIGGAGAPMAAGTGHTADGAHGEGRMHVDVAAGTDVEVAFGTRADVASGNGAHHGTIQADSQAAGDAAGSEQAQIADGCCACAHGCHGVHNLMLPTTGLLLASEAAQSWRTAYAGRPGLDAGSRIDRPRWLAA